MRWLVPIELPGERMTTTASSMPWIDDYEPHEWAVYDVPVTAESAPRCVEQAMYTLIIGAESESARHNYEMRQRGLAASQPFYYDMEQILGAGLDQTYGMAGVSQLADDWTAPDGTVYKAGSLVMQTYRGIPEFYTWLIART